ncbi:MAG: phospholipase D-like domain-containing protein [Pseudomonadota bacterium]
MAGNRKRPRWGRYIALVLASIVAGTAWWQTSKPLPPGLHVSGVLTPVAPASMQLLTDVTAHTNLGEPVFTRGIHAATLDLIRDAHDFLVLDYFLFNEQGGPAGKLRYESGIRPVARELREALLALRRAQPALPILLLIDPINGYYRDIQPVEMSELTQAGVDIVVVDLDPLRDSNPLYSAPWRLLARWWLKPGVNGAWFNPLAADGPPLTLGSLLRVPNFKADHRKLLLTGDGAGSLVGIVSSANPHDASSAHSNVALRLGGEVLRPLLDSELAIARFSGWHDTFIADAAQRARAAAATRVPSAVSNPVSSTSVPQSGPLTDTSAAIATEGAIRDQLITALGATERGDSIDIAMFYLSDRQVIRALLAAADRGAAIRVLLDPNKDAFGFEKSGLPNREVASELVAASAGAIKLRWYRTHGEQFHVKLAAIRSDHRLWLTLGSANFTRRNIGDYNLEANAIVSAPLGSGIDAQESAWFETLWNNHPGGIEYTADTDLYADPSQGRYWLYRFMEASGMCTF